MASIAEGLIDRPRSGLTGEVLLTMSRPLARGFAERRAARGSAMPVSSSTAERARALASQFPVVRQLSGDESFMACVRRFVLAQSRRLPAPSDVGTAFPDFVRTLGSAACYAYLADIAELELSCVRAAGAHDTPPLGDDALTSLALQTFGARVTLHPSVSLLRSRFPIVSVWDAVRQGAPAPLADCGAECALVARPIREVEVRKLAPGAFTFLTLLTQGVQLAQAAERAARAVPGFDVAARLALLGESRLVTELR